MGGREAHKGADGAVPVERGGEAEVRIGDRVTVFNCGRCVTAHVVWVTRATVEVLVPSPTGRPVRLRWPIAEFYERLECAR